MSVSLSTHTRPNTHPLGTGSGALAGHPFGIDRDLLAEDLGFERASPNSMDAGAHGGNLWGDFQGRVTFGRTIRFIQVFEFNWGVILGEKSLYYAMCDC